MAETVNDLRGKILNVVDVPQEDIFVPEWDATVRVKGMTGEQRALFFERNQDGSVRTLTASMIAAQVYDPDTDELVFTEADIDAINQKASFVLERLAKRISVLSGIGQDAEVELKDAQQQFR